MRLNSNLVSFLPHTVIPNDEENNGYEILAEWGVSPWAARRLPGVVDTYAGWQHAILPRGWSISFEGHEMYVLDDRNQERGVIEDMLDTVNGHKAQPRLTLSRSIRYKDSFCMGENGPYTFELCNPYGEKIYGYTDIKIARNDLEDESKRINQELIDWVTEKYPDYKSYTAYWDHFHPQRTVMA